MTDPSTLHRSSMSSGLWRCSTIRTTATSQMAKQGHPDSYQPPTDGQRHRNNHCHDEHYKTSEKKYTAKKECKPTRTDSPHPMQTFPPMPLSRANNLQRLPLWTMLPRDPQQNQMMLTNASEKLGIQCLTKLAQTSRAQFAISFASPTSMDQKESLTLPPLDGQTLMTIAAHAKATSAPSFDNIKAPELKLCPFIASQGLANLFNLIEDGHKWPDTTLTTKAVWLLKPKSDPADPISFRILIITPAIYIYIYI